MIAAPTLQRIDRRRAAIIAAARHLFVAQGYERTTLAEIVTLAGGSLATVYKLFGNKDRLLEAVVLENAASGETMICEAVSLGVCPAATLRVIADGLHEQFLDPDVIALVRIVIARSICDPQFARQFFERTTNPTRDAIEALFAKWRDDGVPLKEAPDFLADMFMGLFVNDLQRQAISHGAAVRQAPEAIHQRTDFFIQAAGIAAQVQ
ncbi:TetR/AcrR family transcriptional regulator [Erythrobacter sp. R86502]|uniref:TetR/AcrR family transcriptional regulator n=1 Tax=Erythrobacter sp. R86502 TaxID=3093846 RepID=UPI0036D3DD3F